MIPRDVFEATCYAALAKYKINVSEGMWRVTADNTLIDMILKAADKYAYGADLEKQRNQIRARDLDAALDKMLTEARTPEARADVLAAARTDIGRQPTYGTKSKP